MGAKEINMNSKTKNRIVRVLFFILKLYALTILKARLIMVCRGPGIFAKFKKIS